MQIRYGKTNISKTDAECSGTNFDFIKIIRHFLRSLFLPCMIDLNLKERHKHFFSILSTQVRHAMALCRRRLYLYNKELKFL